MFVLIAGLLASLLGYALLVLFFTIVQVIWASKQGRLVLILLFGYLVLFGPYRCSPFL